MKTLILSIVIRNTFTSVTLFTKIFLLTLIFFSCQKDVPGEEVNNSKITVYSDKSDSRWFTYNSFNFSDFTFYGTKTLDGFPDKLNIIRKANSDSTELGTYFFLDSEKRIESILTVDGLRIDISYDQYDNLNLTFLTGDGEYQLSTSLDHEPARRTSYHQNLNPRGGIATQIRPTGNVERIIDSKSILSQGVLVNVYNCGMIPTNADKVFVRMYDGNLNKIGVFPANHIGMGLYSAILPSNVAGDYILTAKDLCNFGVALASGGIVIKGGKIALTIALREGLKRAASDKVKKEIEKAIEDVQTLNDIATEIGKIKELFCTAKLDEYSVNFGGVKFIVEAHSPGNGNNPIEVSRGIVYSPMIESNANATYPNLSVNLGDNSRIKGPILLNPERPNVNQGYTASANFECLPLNTRIVMEVSGTDGYYDRQVFITDFNNSHQFSLWVPGAKAKGIQDIVTVYGATPSSHSIGTRKASLVFGE